MPEETHEPQQRPAVVHEPQQRPAVVWEPQQPPAAPEQADQPLAERVRAVAPGLAPLLAQARAVQRERAAADGHSAPRWTDVFTTQFTEFSNRPR